ncbi:MAG: acyl-CoA thioesterase [Thermoanaerobaculia bacterium]
MEPFDPAQIERDYIFATRRLVMYSDLNAAGRLFGGQLMGWLDEATAQAAARIMGTKSLVTKKFGEVVFDHPGKLGDSVEIWCRVEREGTTSLTLDCRVLVRAVAPETLRQICHSTVVYVALDEQGRPVAWRPSSRSSPRTPSRRRGRRA